jgi:hypothetical protein
MAEAPPTPAVAPAEVPEETTPEPEEQVVAVCEDCGEEVALDATSCPGCGAIFA